MTRDPIADQPVADENTQDELTDGDRVAADDAKKAVAFLAARDPASSGGGGLLAPEASSAPAFQPGRMECSFALPAASLVAGIVAVHLPPSDLGKFLRRHEKPLSGPLHQLCLTVDASGLRLTNRKLGAACEHVVPLTSYAPSGAASHSFHVSLAHLEGLFPDRPYRTPFRNTEGQHRSTEKTDWAKMPEVTLIYCQPERRVTVYVGESQWDLPAEPCDPPGALPDVPDDEPVHHGLVARVLEKAIRFAGTFSAFGRQDPMCGMISISDGAARGGFAGAASRFESDLLAGFEFDISADDAAALRSVLLRLDAFRMITDGDRMLISDHGMRVSIDLAKHSFHDVGTAMQTIEASGVAVGVSLHELHHAARVATVLQPQETDRQPVYVDGILSEEDDKKLLCIQGMTPAGHCSWVAVDTVGSSDVPARGDVLWTARSAHLKRATIPTDCHETAKIVASDQAVLLVLEREGGILTHILLIPKVDRPKPAPADEVPVELDPESADHCPEREVCAEHDDERPAPVVEA